jgi:23S rRNA (cytidine1920-2'-O)/16S rRNA (cytidine1409-2'-O)-methyltransferase
VKRGLVESRSEAAELISAGRVLVSGAVADKAARLVAPGDPLVVCGPAPRFVSRGGEKLDAALERFGVAVEGRAVLDAGASTGGFTDCLLQRGAASVVAVDVGHGQLDPRLRQDPRVVVVERFNVRQATPGALGGHRFDLVSADLSFISLRSVAGALLGMAGEGADVVVLVKPQFEVGRQAVSRGKGVVRDPGLWVSALDGVLSAFASAGAAVMGVMVSPLHGARGNVEFLVHLRAARSPEARASLFPGGLAEAAVAEAVAMEGGAPWPA